MFAGVAGQSDSSSRIVSLCHTMRALKCMLSYLTEVTKQIEIDTDTDRAKGHSESA